MRVLLGGTEEKSVFLMRGHRFALQSNQWFLTKRSVVATPVNIDVVGILPPHAIPFLPTLMSHFETVRVHRCHDVNPSVVYEVRHSLSPPIVLAEVLHQKQKHLTTNRFVAVHIRQVFEFGLKGLMDLKIECIL